MKGDTNSWSSWELHIFRDSEDKLPLDILVTPASNYDGTMPLSLIKQFFQHYNDIFKPTYYAIDLVMILIMFIKI